MMWLLGRALVLRGSVVSRSVEAVRGRPTMNGNARGDKRRLVLAFRTGQMPCRRRLTTEGALRSTLEELQGRRKHGKGVSADVRAS